MNPPTDHPPTTMVLPDIVDAECMFHHEAMVDLNLTPAAQSRLFAALRDYVREPREVSIAIEAPAALVEAWDLLAASLNAAWGHPWAEVVTDSTTSTLTLHIRCSVPEHVLQAIEAAEAAKAAEAAGEAEGHAHESLNSRADVLP